MIDELGTSFARTAALRAFLALALAGVLVAVRLVALLPLSAVGFGAGDTVALLISAVAGQVALVAGGTSSAQTTSWNDYLGGPAASHYSPLKQVNPGNVNNLDVAWTYPTGDDVTYTFSPLVIDNIAYIAARQGSLVAVDARCLI